MIRRVELVLFGVLVTCGVPCSALAVTVYVSTTGVDSGDCTSPSSPCATIQYAADQTTLDVQVMLTTGDYFGDSMFNEQCRSIRVTGGWNEDFTQRVLSPSATVVHGRIWKYDLDCERWCTFKLENFSVTDASIAVRVYYAWDNDLEPIVGGWVSLDGMLIVGNYNGVYLGSDAIHYLGPYDVGLTISNSAIVDNSGVGVEVYSCGGGVTVWPEIRYSTITGSGDIGLIMRESDVGILLGEVSSSILWGNNIDAQISCSYSSYVSFGTSDSDIGTVDVDASCVYQPGDGLFDADPLLIEGEHEYHLSMLSPCIDRVDTGPSADIDGDSRPSRYRYDIGADEYAFGDSIFSDGFESGTTASWSETEPPL